MGVAIFSLLHLIFNANTYNKLSPRANYEEFMVKKRKYTFIRMPTGLSYLLLMRSHLHILMHVWNRTTGKFANCAHILYRIISFPLILKSFADCLTYCFIEVTSNLMHHLQSLIMSHALWFYSNYFLLTKTLTCY